MHFVACLSTSRRAGFEARMKQVYKLPMECPFQWPNRGFAAVFIGLVLAHLTPSLAADSPGDHAKPPNIVFILVDDLRFDGMGFLQEQLQTPKH